MPNLLIVSDNDLFKQDLIFQINKYAPDFIINSQDNIADIIIIDENTEIVNSYLQKYIHVPLLILIKNGIEKPQEQKLITYIPKPFNLNKLIDSLNSAINLVAHSEAGNLTFNKYELKPTSKEILNLRNNEIIKLTEKEVSILQYLYKIKNRIVTKSELLQEVWKYNPDVTTHTIETHVYRLRQKVEHDDTSAQLIITEEGGYILKR